MGGRNGTSTLVPLRAPRQTSHPGAFTICPDRAHAIRGGGDSAPAPAQLGRSCAAIGGPFAGIGNNHLLGCCTEVAVANMCPECLLDQTVFQTVKGDDHRCSPGRENSGDAFKQSLELAELIVDDDTQSLEGSQCRVARVTTRYGASDHFRDVRAAAHTRCHRGAQGGRNASAAALLTVAEEDVGEVRVAGFRDELKRRSRATVAHAEIEVGFAANREAALRVIELQAGDAEVSKQAIELFARRTGSVNGIGVGAGANLQAFSMLGEALLREWTGRGIAIDPDHRRTRGEQGRAVSTKPERAIKHALARRRSEMLAHGFEQDGVME